MSHKHLFRRFLGAAPGRLHFAAHSHHLWPDATFEAHQRAWLDAAEYADVKWDLVLGELLPRLRSRIARVLSLPDADTLAFAPNTHELVVRLFSSLQGRRPVRVLATGSEFHSFERQSRRWEEAGLATVRRVPAEPWATLPGRLEEEVAGGGHDLVYFSQVLFDSGFAFEDLGALVGAVPGDEALVVIDGYHGFMARPTDLGPVADRAFYLAGGYKYAMSGEGACFAHCPPGRVPRPVDTGWFATFGSLEAGVGGGYVPFSSDGFRLHGATFEPTALYRMDAALELLEGEGLTVQVIHEHVVQLQGLLLDGLGGLGVEGLGAAQLVPDVGLPRGHFLTFRTDRAEALHRGLLDRGVVTDRRGDRLRIGFGIYQDPADVAELLQRARGL